jgi:hypothetical protein
MPVGTSTQPDSRVCRWLIGDYSAAAEIPVSETAHCKIG